METALGTARPRATSAALATATGTGQAKWQPARSAFIKIGFRSVLKLGLSAGVV